MKSKPVLIIFSILAGLGVITASTALGDLIGVKLALVLILLREAVQVGMNFYVHGIVTPTQDVAAYQNSSGQVVAGPAAGATNGTPVSVEPGTREAGFTDTRTMAILALVIAVVVVVILLL